MAFFDLWISVFLTSWDYGFLALIDFITELGARTWGDNDNYDNDNNDRDDDDNEAGHDNDDNDDGYSIMWIFHCLFCQAPRSRSQCTVKTP